MEREWREIVASAIGKFTTNSTEVDEILGRLKTHPSYGWLHSMWTEGTLPCEACRMLIQTLEAMGLQKSETKAIERERRC